MIRRRILILAISISLIPIWGLGLLSADISGPITAAFAYLITGLVIYFARKLLLDSLSYLLISIGPVFYAITSVIFSQEPIFLQPVVQIFICFCLVLWMSYLKSVRYTVFIVMIGIISTLLQYQFQTEITQEKAIAKPIAIDTTRLLSEFDFIDYKMDTVKIQTGRKFVLIETWNETCAPCIKSMMEIQDEIAKMSKVEHYFLYQNREGSKLTFNEIHHFKYIKSIENSLIDIENQLFQEMGLQAYPYFILFHTSGEVMGYIRGYKGKNQVLQELNRIMDPDEKPKKTSVYLIKSTLSI